MVQIQSEEGRSYQYTLFTKLICRPDQLDELASKVLTNPEESWWEAKVDSVIYLEEVVAEVQ